MAEKISATIICHNEKKHIRDCIKSLGFCDEIVVVDSFSVDGTGEIARSMGCMVVQREYKGTNDQKEFARTLAAGPWVFNIDGDEIASEGLGKELVSAIEKGGYSAFSVPFVSYFGEDRIAFGRFGGERHVRVFKKGVSRYDTATEPHDRLMVEGKTGKLFKPIIHYSYEDFEDAEEKSERYARLAAGKLGGKGKRPTLFSQFLNPSWRFFRQFFLKLGFLDGRLGYKMAMLSAREGYLKYKLARDIKYKT